MRKNKNDCDLKSCILCKQCLPEWLPAMESNRKNFNFRKGDLLFSEGEPVKGMFFLYSGKVKVHKKWGDDKELIVRLAKKGDIVGHRGIGGDTYYPVSATALESVTVCFIDLDFFQSTLKVNQGFLYELMMFYARELKESENNMRNLAHMPVKNRVANILLQLQSKFGKNSEGYIDISLSKQDLCSIAGAAYETVFRVVKELKDEEILDEDGKFVKIKNEKILRQLVE
jgi:CRP-like cAMP-binding protein